MLGKKGPSSSFPLPVLPLRPLSRPSLYRHSSLFSLLANPLLVLQSHTDTKDHTERSHRRHHFDCHLSPPSPVCGGPAEWSSPCCSHCVHFPSFPFSAATVLLFFNMWGRGVSMILLVFFISKVGGGVCESCFSSFRPNKAHPMASCPPLFPPLSLTPLPSPTSCPVCLRLCALCEPLFLLITITVHPPSPKLVNTTQSFCVL